MRKAMHDWLHYPDHGEPGHDCATAWALFLAAELSPGAQRHVMPQYVSRQEMGRLCAELAATLGADLPALDRIGGADLIAVRGAEAAEMNRDDPEFLSRVLDGLRGPGVHRLPGGGQAQILQRWEVDDRLAAAQWN